MDKFFVRPEIFFGGYALDNYLKSIAGKQAFIVTDQVMVKLGIEKEIERVLKENGMSYHLFAEVEPDPSIETVKKGVIQFNQFKPDILIGVGGGSPIDVAKAILYFSIQLQKQFIDVKLISKPKFIAIPTTSGTGSEVTSYSVITDKANNVKIPLSDPMMTPDIAILDEKLTQTVPPAVTADTGMDVLTHALEALVSKEETEFTNMYAERAIKRVFTYLPRAYKYGSDLNARKYLHIASCMAGIAFTNATLGINHSLAHSIGAKFHLPHGRSNAIILPYVVAFNGGINDASVKIEKTAEKYAEVAKWLELPAETVEQGVKSLVAAIIDLNGKMGIPLTLQAAGITKDSFEAGISEIAEAALQDMCTAGNPKEVTKEDMIQILRQAYTG